MADNRWRIAVTGIGLVTPLGLSAEETVRRILSGERAPRLQLANAELAAGVAAAVVPPFDIAKILRNPKNLKLMSRTVRMALHATREAVDASSLSSAGVPPERIGVYVGSGQTGLEYDEFFKALTLAWEAGREQDFKYLGGMPARVIDRYFSLRTLANAGVAAISTEFGARGPSNNYVQGETAPAVALYHAAQDLMENRCDAALVCGYESLLIPSMYAAARKVGILSGDGFGTDYFPFASPATGLVLGEGAAAFVLESDASARDRGATVLAEIDGIGLASQTADVAGLTALPDDIHAAARSAGFDRTPAFVVARGLGTEADDLAEAEALSSLFPRETPITAFKGQTGYLGAATAGVELAIGVLCARAGIVPPILSRTETSPRPPFVSGSALQIARTQDEVEGLFFSSTFGGQVAAIAAAIPPVGEPVHG